MKEDPWFHETVRNQVGQIVRIRKVLSSEKTPFQQIDVLDTPQFGRILVLDGAINVGERDEFIYSEGTWWSFAFCSKEIDPLEDVSPPDGWMEQIETQYYDGHVHRAAFIVPRCIKRIFDLPEATDWRSSRGRGTKATV